MANKNTRLQLVFDRPRCDQLSTGGLQQLFFAVGDVKKSVVINASNVARFEVSVSVAIFRLMCRMLPVPGENIWPLHQQLAIVGNFACYLRQLLAILTHAVGRGSMNRQLLMSCRPPVPARDAGSALL